MSSTRPKAGGLAFLGSVLLAVLTATIVCVLALALPIEDSRPIFEETGPFEQASPWLWLAFALWIPLVFRKPTLEVAAGMVVAIAAAGREWDWHIKFTEYSMLKPPFYYREGTMPERIIAGGIMIAVIASIVILIARLIHLRPWKRPWAWWVFALGFAFFMLVFTKVVDRAPAIMDEDFGLTLGPRMRVMFSAIEEGLEMLLPVFFGAHALALARRHAGRKAAGQPPKH